MNNETKNSNINALVVEGGAMRGIFATGVLDAFLQNKFNPFNLYIGVSAGSTNLASYLAEMYQRNYKVYTDYSIRPDFISWKKFFLGGHLIDLDWLWDITIKELRLDLDAIFNKDGDFYVGVTEAETGKAKYFKPEKHNLEHLIKASSSLPILYRKSIKVNDIDFVDGGLADPIPVIEAYKRGAKNIMVIRSRPYSFTMKPNKNSLITKSFLRKYPNVYEAMLNRHKVYEESIEFMRNPPKDINIIEVNPPEDFKTERLTKDLNILKEDYKKAHAIGADTIEQWNNMIG